MTRKESRVLVAQRRQAQAINRAVNKAVAMYKQMYENLRIKDAEKDRLIKQLKTELKAQKAKNKRASIKVSNVIKTYTNRMRTLINKSLPTALRTTNGKMKAAVPGPFSGMLGNKGLETAANIIQSVHGDFYEKAMRFINEHGDNGKEKFCNCLAEYFIGTNELDYTYDAFQIREDGYLQVIDAMENYQEAEARDLSSEYGGQYY